MEQLAEAAARGPEALGEVLSREPGLALLTDASGQTALHAVCSVPGCQAEAVALVLQRQQDVNAADKFLWTPLHCAAKHSSLEVVDLLLEVPGIAVNARNGEGTTPLHYLARRPESDHLRVILDKLDRLGADFGSANGAQETPLHLACAQQEGCARLLLAHGCNVNALNKKGESPLHYAARSGRTAAAELLLDAGARLEAGEHGSPLAVVDPSRPELVHLLNQAAQRPLNASRGAMLRSSVAGMARLRPGQRRLEQVVGLAIRELPHALKRSLLTLHVTQSGPAALAIEGAPDTRNPEWDVDGTRAAAATCAEEAAVVPPRVSVFWICVWEEADQLALKRRVSLSELAYMGHELSERHVVFPPSSLLVELPDGFYVEEHVLQQLSTQARLPTVPQPRPMTAESYTVGEFAALIQASQQHREWAAEAQQLQQALNAALLAQGTENGSQVAHRDVRLLELQTRRAQLQERLAAERQLTEEAQQLARTSCVGVLQGRSWIGAADAALDECARRTLPELQQQSAALRTATHDLHAGMLRQLRAVFPVEQQQPGGFWSICGIRLPHADGFGGCDVEVIATALGHVCHAAHVAARWLGVTLRYEVLPMSSRSIIRDDISVQGSGSTKFPLYARGVDRTRFEYGVFLLNKDIEQLLQSQGVGDIEPLKHTLPNLHKLLNLM